MLALNVLSGQQGEQLGRAAFLGPGFCTPMKYQDGQWAAGSKVGKTVVKAGLMKGLSKLYIKGFPPQMLQISFLFPTAV